jgi:hypothetical protein
MKMESTGEISVSAISGVLDAQRAEQGQSPDFSVGSGLQKLAVGEAFFRWSKDMLTHPRDERRGNPRSRQGEDPVMGRTGKKSEGSAQSDESLFLNRRQRPRRACPLA